MAGATRTVSTAYALVFSLLGLLMAVGLLAQGWSPFIIAAAGAFMLVGPAILAGFFGIAQAFEDGMPIGLQNIGAGFANASSAVWVLALVCALLFMIFITDAAILYAYLVGAAPIALENLLPTRDDVASFVIGAAGSGVAVAFLLYCIAAFSVPLLCDRRAGLVEAVVISVRIVLGSFAVSMCWAFLLSAVIIGSVLLLPLLPLTLPWMAYAGRALYREVLPHS